MEHDIQIPEDLRGCHPIITKTRQAQLDRPKPTASYAAPKPILGILDVYVSKTALPRALRLLEAIIRASEKGGWSVEGKDEKSRSCIKIGDDPVSFSMAEQSDRIELPSTKEEKAQWYWKPKHDYRKNGRLTLQITNWLPKGMRCSWSDGKRQRLENVLNEFLDGVAEASVALKERRLEREEWDRQYEAQVRQREDHERRVKVERQRRADLFAQATGREKAVLIRKMIRDLQRCASRAAAEWPAEDLTRWVNWAGALASRSDPFTNGYFERALDWSELDAELKCEPEE